MSMARRPSPGKEHVVETVQVVKAAKEISAQSAITLQDVTTEVMRREEASFTHEDTTCTGLYPLPW